MGLISAQNSSGDGMGIEYACTAGQTHLAITDSDLLRNGNEFYASVQAEDLAGHRTTLTLGPILIDLSPPLVNGTLQVQQMQDHVIVTWEQDTITEEEDAEGSITLRYAIGKQTSIFHVSYLENLGGYIHWCVLSLK